MNSIEKINFLLGQLESKLKTPNAIDDAPLLLRKNNLKEIAKLYESLGLFKKHPNFSTLFNYTAMNLAGIGLKDEDFGEIREGKYVQIISIAYELNTEGQRVNKNSSLGYYGKAEKLNEKDKSQIIEFVLRWRYEKSFQHSDHYQELLSSIT
jgi:hypothetical protein